MVLIRFKGSLKKALRKVFPEVQFPGKERRGRWRKEGKEGKRVGGCEGPRHHRTDKVHPI